MQVVVVESPAKAKTISRYLGPDFTVLASYGHVSDLPSRDGSVRPEQDFEMTFETSSRSLKALNTISTALDKADSLVLATDPDREGEAIAWHVLNWLRDKGATADRAVKRVVFNEITSDAVRSAMAEPRDIDMHLVEAQLARRALDYLIGFTLSPVLWHKLPGCDCKSAGRVQSVALRLICEREAEIERFVPREYWSVDADLGTPGGALFTARLHSLDGVRLEKFTLTGEAMAGEAAASVQDGAFAVDSVERKKAKRNPPPPFTTSTLQQDASRRFGFSVQDTMRQAQRLYEGRDIGGETTGLITYMRTDSVVMSQAAIRDARRLIADSFGGAYLPDRQRTFTTRARNAQEAHEAIRPTDFGRTPEAMARYLEDREARLYALIWKRALASQMAEVRFDQTTVDIRSPVDGLGGRDIGLRASGSVMVFDGFTRLYRESTDGKESDSGDRRLPDLAEGDRLEVREVRPQQHFTEPPPRLTEATLVKRLEELGIGRPSTYAPIIGVLKDKEYVTLERRQFHPADRGRLLVAFLETFFGTYVQYTFTADMEQDLDRISNGNANWKAVLREFWDAFERVTRDTRNLDLRHIVESIERILEDDIYPDQGDGNRRACPSCKDGTLNLKLGKFGAFIGCSAYPDCRYTKNPFDRNGNAAPEDNEPRVLGEEPQTGLPVTLRHGKFGPYVRKGEAGSGSATVSVPASMPPSTMTLETALALLALPREVGEHPETGSVIAAGIGRYGPYLKHGSRYINLQDDDVLTIGLNRAVSLIAESGNTRKGGQALRVLGEHPDDQKSVEVMKGRYGPYVRHNRTNASLPAGIDPGDVTLEMALDLLARRKAAPKSRRKPPRKARKSVRTT